MIFLSSCETDDIWKTRGNISAEAPDRDGNALYKATGTDVSVSHSWTQLVFDIINRNFLKQVLQLEHDVLILRRICIFPEPVCFPFKTNGCSAGQSHWQTATGGHKHTLERSSITVKVGFPPLITEASTQRFSSHHALPLEPITPLT